MVKHVARALSLADRQLERLVGLRVVNRDRHVTIGGVPEEADMNAVADPAVELTRARRRRAAEETRMGGALILDVWIDHAGAPLLLS
jgi:hypothetical protein